MVASHHDHHPQPDSSLRRLLLRCHSRLRSHQSSNKYRLALICFALAAAVALGKLSHSSTFDTKRGGHHLRAHHQQNELLQALFELPLPTTDEELDELNEELKDLDPQYILQWAYHQLGTTTQHDDKTMHPLVQVTSFGPTGLVILHLLSQLHLLKDVPIVTMDTLHLFNESYDFYETIKSYYKSNEMELVITKPLRIDYPLEMNGEGEISGVIESRKEFEQTYGSTLWKTNPQKFTQLTKIDPMKKALDEFHAQMWITGRRRSSGGERSSMDVLEFEYSSEDAYADDDESDSPFDTSKGRWKLNPLAYWTYQQVWEYIRKHQLPYNGLYDKGYTSLGDQMTTDLPQSKTTRTGDSVDALERSGRFIGLGNQTECGLHSHLQKVKKQKQQALEAGEELLAPKLVCEKCIDLTVDNFEKEITATGDNHHEKLVEFYSPFCGGCKHFAPTLNKLANQLSINAPNIQVARFDITESDIPQINKEELFIVESTPTLYRVRYKPSFHVEKYNGSHDFESILRWLTIVDKGETGRKQKAGLRGT